MMAYGPATMIGTMATHLHIASAVDQDVAQIRAIFIWDVVN